MGLIPTTLGTRPRLAVEIRPEGVVAARAEDAEAILTAIAPGAPAPGSAAKPAANAPANSPASRRDTVAAVKRALEAVALSDRRTDRRTTLVVPDAAVRVLLLDFEQLPTKTIEALPIIRFRLKKLLPFDADDAVISYQIMSQTRSLIRVLAVAIPKETLAEYESLVREAGFEPGAVLPSTLAACAGLPELDAATLIVNAGESSVTTAIVQGGILLLHRTVDLANESAAEEAVPLALVDAHTSAGEWARQEPVNGYGVLDDHHIQAAHAQAAAALEAQRFNDQIASEVQGATPREQMLPPIATTVPEWEASRHAATAREITQALSVAAAYFEDTLHAAPGEVLAAGTIGAESLSHILNDAGFGEPAMRVREMVEPAMLAGAAVSTRVPHGWVAGVRGALRS